MRHYVSTFALTLLTLCAAAVMFCLTVDPYSQNTPFAIPSFAPNKYFEDTRTAKALNLLNHDYDAIILGSSRTEIGLSPKDPAWGSQRVYNAALAGSNLYETHRVFQHVLNTQSPRIILLGVDFGLFSDNRSISSDFALSRFDDHTPVSAFFKENLSKPAIEKAIRTLRDNADGEPVSHLSGQRLSSASFMEKIQRRGQHAYIYKILNAKVITNREAYSVGAYSAERMQLFRDMVDACEARGIRLIAFISPIHALQLAAIHELGLWPEFETWKRDLAAILADHPELPVYDYSNWNSYIQEPIPAPGSDDLMRWYWETSHYREELGSLMLEEMLTEQTAEIEAIATRLTPQIIETELRRQRDRRDAWLAAHPSDIANIHCLISATCDPETLGQDSID